MTTRATKWKSEYEHKGQEPGPQVPITQARMRQLYRLPRRRQRPVKGGRPVLGTGIDLQIKDALRAVGDKFNASMSMVSKTILCRALGIDLPSWDCYDYMPEHVTPPKRVHKADTRKEGAA